MPDLKTDQLAAQIVYDALSAAFKSNQNSQSRTVHIPQWLDREETYYKGFAPLLAERARYHGGVELWVTERELEEHPTIGELIELIADRIHSDEVN